MQDTTTIGVQSTSNGGEALKWKFEVLNSTGVVVYSYETSAYYSTYTWTWNGTNGTAVVPDGNYTIMITAYDLAGNPATNTTWVVVDTVPPSPPQIYFPQNGSYINSAKLYIQWNWTDTNFANATLYIYNSTGLYLTVYLNATVTSYLANLPDDSYTVYIVVIDYAGNSNKSNVVHFTVDTVLPTPFSLSAPANNTYTNNTTVNFTWEASYDEHFYHYDLVVEIGNNTYVYFTTDTWYVLNLQPGEYAIQWFVRAYDLANNVRVSNETFTLYIDTIAPRNVGVVAPTGLINNTNNATFIWNAVNDTYFSHYELVILHNGAVIYSSNTTSTNATVYLNDGNYSWYVIAYDLAGNFNKSAVAEFTIDTQPPVVTGYTTRQYWNSTVPIWINATDNGTGVQYIYVYYSWQGGAWQLYGTYSGNTTFINVTFTTAGFYQIALVGEDYAGHTEAITPDLSITIDRSPPTGGVTADNGATYTANGTVLVNISYSDDYGVQYYRYKVDNGSWSAWIVITPSTSGYITFWLTLPSVEGNHTVYVQLMDMANNTSPIYSDSIESDLYAPVYQDGNVTPHYSGDGNATVWVNATDNVSGVEWIWYSFDGVNWTKIVYVSNFTINFTVEGVVYVYIVFEDYVGHNSTEIILNYTVDLTPPYGSLTLNATYNTVNITIYLNASDNITWVTYFRYKVDNGTWSNWTLYTTEYVVNVQTSGTHTIYVQYMDKVGHISAIYSSTTIISTTPPTVDFTVENATANNTVGFENITLLINATSDAGLSQMRIVVVNESGAVIFDSGWIAYADNYTVNINITGSYNITVYVKDNANNEANATHSIYVDLEAPVIGSYSIKHYLIYENSTTVQINASDYSGVVRWGYSVNGSSIIWFGSSVITIDIPVGEANYTITLYAMDMWGHVSSVSTWIYEVRHTPTGSVSVTEHLTNNDTITVYLSASDPVFTVVGMWIKIDNGAWVYYNYTTSVVIQITTDGNHTIYVKYVTDIGTESDIYSTWVVVDTAPPTTEIVTHLPSYTNATSITFTVQGSDSLSGFAYYKVYIRINGGTWEFVGTYLPNQTTVTISLTQEGTYNIAIVGYDRAGNHEDITTKATIVVDRSAPVLNVNGGNTTLTLTFNYTISWNATDNTGIAYYLIIIYKGDMGKAEPWKVINTTSTSVLITFEDNATYTIIIRAYDLAGNWVEKTLTITEDFNYPPKIVEVDIPQNATAGKETTFYADVVDVKGDALNYTWLLDNETVGYGQYLKLKLTAGNHTLVLIVTDGVYKITRQWNITVKAVQGGGEVNTSPDMMDILVPMLFLFGLIGAVAILLILMIKRRKPKEEPKEEGLSDEELVILNELKDYVENHEGEKIDEVIKAVAQKIGISESEVMLVLDYGASHGIFTKETDLDGNLRVYMASKNVELEEKAEDEGGD